MEACLIAQRQQNITEDQGRLKKVGKNMYLYTVQAYLCMHCTCTLVGTVPYSLQTSVLDPVVVKTCIS